MSQLPTSKPVATSLPPRNMVWIPSGSFVMGSDNHYPEEAPAHHVAISGFWIDRYAVTNQQFARFVDETTYVTVAERVPDAAAYPGSKAEMLVAASTVFVKPSQRVDIRNAYNWWTWVPGANWLHPSGPKSTLKGLS